MSTFKCKMCGGALEITGGATVATCEYCGTQQTLPRLDDDRRANLYDRANHFRRSNEFDKAMGIYEQILAEDNADAEAYWSLVLCRYGIEYVEDPTSHRRVPTVNRAQYTSIFDDENYKSALQYADSFQRGIYEEEAKAINEIQKGILAISQKEEPFDVFICYKESDSNGRRTQDSVLANDLYHQLTQEGFKVFFSRITLEDKLGSAYEPYIFAALNSAKIMVVLGTRPEYFNAVWVKNEWSRYLALIRQGQKKMLIPAYKDMDPYDLPEEFSHLQAQDMSKLGFMQDLIRGIKKIAQASEPKPTVVKETIVTGGGADTAPLLKRAFMFLEDGEWASANEYCEKVLDIDPENAQAYLGKLMAELRVNTPDGLKNGHTVIDEMGNYQKALRFADGDLKRALEGYRQSILNNIYLHATERMRCAANAETYEDLAREFDSIHAYQDSAALAAECRRRAEDERRRAEEEKRQKITQQIEAMRRKRTDWNMAAGPEHIVCLRVDGTVVAAGENGSGQCDVSDWTDIVAVAAGSHHTVGLKADGTVVATGYNKKGACKVSRWRDIVAVAAKDDYTVGLRVDGTVVAVGDNSLGKCGVFDWTDIVTVIAGKYHTVGLKADGTVVMTGEGAFRVSRWTDIVAVVGGYPIVGLKADGTVVTTGDDVPDWTNIVAIADGDDHTVGLKADGTVVATGDNGNHTCDVSGWGNIVAVAAARKKTIGLRADGSVVYAGPNSYWDSKSGRDVKYRYGVDWADIVAVAAGDRYTVGLKADGTMLAVGGSERLQHDVSEWKDIVIPESLVEKIREWAAERQQARERCRPKREALERAMCRDITYRNISKYGKGVLKSDGTIMVPAADDQRSRFPSGWTDIVEIAGYVGLKADGTVVAMGFGENSLRNVSGWTDIVAVSGGIGYTVGLRSDGTVVAVGSNSKGECDVSGWTDIVMINDGYYYTVGLKADGTVVAVGDNEYGQCDVSGWRDIIAVTAGLDHTVGLKADGTVVAVGNNEDGQCNVSDWTDIVAVIGGGCCTIGLKADGTVVATGYNEDGECDVISNWTNIVAISAGHGGFIGLKADGSIVSTYSKSIQRIISGWTDIVAVWTASEEQIIGLRADGTAVMTETDDRDYSWLAECKDIALPKIAIEEREKIRVRMYTEMEQRRAEQERVAKERRAEQRRAAKRRREEQIAKLRQEQTELQTELANLRGLFTGRRRREIEARLAEIEKELK